MTQIFCTKCGRGIEEVTARGNYLERANRKGIKAMWRCSPDCGKNSQKVEDMLNKALRGKTNDE